VGGGEGGVPGVGGGEGIGPQNLPFGRCERTRLPS
jgi:hypothetical protein